MAYIDSVGLSSIWQGIKSLLNGKVDKEENMGLSQENYTTEDKESVSSLNDAMEFLVAFGNLSTSEGAWVLDSSNLHIVETKVTSNTLADNKEEELVLYIIDKIQEGIYEANRYTDDKFTNSSVATTDTNGFMSSVDKARLDEIWEAWSTKRFLTVAKE